jgi:hypothetical protein
MSVLSDVEDVYSNEQFTEVTNSLYDTFLLHIEKWSNSVLPLDMYIGHYLRILLRGLGRNYVVQSILLMLAKINEDELLDEFIHIANISETRIDEWTTESHLSKDGLRYSSSWEIYFVKKHTINELLGSKPSSEAARYTATEEILSILWNTQVHHCVHKSPPLVPTVSQSNPV